MTDFTKPGYYQMRNGERAWVAGVVPKDVQGGPFVLVGCTCQEEGSVSWTKQGWHWSDGREDDEDLISPWEDPAEEIDVGDYWVKVGDGVDKILPSVWCHKEKPKPEPHGSTIAILRAHEWQAILRGDRKLIKGEGLE